MGWSRETTREVTISAAGTEYATDTPCSAPFKNLTIILSSNNLEYSTGDLEWEVIYHTNWAGTPFDSDPSGGTVKGSGIIALPSEVIQTIYEDNDFFRANKKVSQTSTYPALQHIGGPAISLKLNNTTADDIKIYVTFISEVISEAQ